MQVMLDTNIFISMFFFPSLQTRELAKRLTENHIFNIFLELPFELVYTPKALDLGEFPEMRDIKDSPILATAIMEGIDVFVTGDKDFLVLDVDTPEIVTMAEFLERY